jgi:16S rRNA (uracil1498-N3)-methyltransferase
MTRRRWIADEFSGNHAALTGKHAEHLARVLRARVGQQFDIAVGEELRRGRITAIHQDRVEFILGELVPAYTPPNLTLLLAVFKFDRMEWAIEKCTELGVARVVPVIAGRTDAHLARAAAQRVERWQRIGRQASEQSRRIAPPRIDSPLKVKDAAALAATTRILLAEGAGQLPLKEALESHSRNEDLMLAVGPEGGWTEAEAARFVAAGWVPAALGHTILRAETAAIAAAAIVVSELF